FRDRRTRQWSAALMKFIGGSSLLRIFRITLAVLCVVFNIRSAHAQETPAQTGSIEGTVSTQSGTVKLPGVLVSIRGASDQELAQEVSNDDGDFVVPNLPADRYHVVASLEGFQSVEGEAVVSPGGVATVSLDLPIAAVSEHVDVKATAPVFEA